VQVQVQVHVFDALNEPLLEKTFGFNVREGGSIICTVAVLRTLYHIILPGTGSTGYVVEYIVPRVRCSARSTLLVMFGHNFLNTSRKSRTRRVGSVARLTYYKGEYVKKS
jgi:hypothetical protein